MSDAAASPIPPAERARPALPLRLRLFLIFVASTLGLLGAVLVASWVLQRQWLESNRARYERQFLDVTDEFGYAELLAERDPAAPAVVRSVLDPELRQVFRTWFSDLLIRSGSTIRTAVDLNPLGARGRPQDFPLQEVREGIRSAMDGRRLVRAAGGFCVRIAVGERVVGGAWFSPRLPPPPPLPFGVVAVPVVVAALAFALVAHWVLERGLVDRKSVV